METLTDKPATTQADDVVNSRKPQAAETLLAGLTPIAMGTVLADGTKWAGSPNWTSLYNPDSTTVPSFPHYEISIVGESYYYLNYVTVVTPLTYKAVTASIGSGGGKMFVYLFDAEGYPVQSHFQFVTYKL